MYTYRSRERRATHYRIAELDEHHHPPRMKIAFADRDDFLEGIIIEINHLTVSIILYGSTSFLSRTRIKK